MLRMFGSLDSIHARVWRLSILGI